MKLNEITETGFYTGELDNKREIIYEVINNTDEEWLKETPEQKLLIDEWTYEYTDEDNRKHYEIYGGNLVAVVNAEPIDVIKITDTKYTMDVSDPTIASKCNGTAMMEAKPTRLEIAQEQIDQLKGENEELKKTVDDLLHKPEIQDKILWKIDNEALLGSKDAYIYKLEQTLTEIKEIAEKQYHTKLAEKDCINCDESFAQILQKISEVIPDEKA